MPPSELDFAPVLAVYSGDCQPKQVEILASAGGFSGSTLWRLKTDRGLLCLRCWPPEHPQPADLAWIHRVLMAAHQAGFHPLPLPILTIHGQSYVQHDDCLWELTAWLPGAADQPNALEMTSSPARVQAALAALAAFHQAANQSPNSIDPNKPVSGPAPGLSRRFSQLHHLLTGGVDQLERHIATNNQFWPELAQRSQRLLSRFRHVAADVTNTSAASLNASVQIQPCIRDIHRDHVLFCGDSVTGIIDFGAMKPDNVACDIARLLGSMALNDNQLWHQGLQSYEAVRPLSAIERQLVSAYDQTAVVLSGINWLQWVFVELRQFNNPNAVLRRFEVILSRLAGFTNVTTC